MSTEPDEAAIGRSALRKASLRILPLIALGYGISYIDRVNISFAALQMNDDLGFSATVYGLGGGLFFLTYALLEVPSNLFLVRFGARRWIARIMLTWGVLAVAMMFVRTPMQFYGMRLLLGAAEAGFFPGIIYYLMQWFPAANRGRAISWFYVAIPLSSVVMGGLAGALLSMDGTLGLHGWQWLFLVEGLPAILLAAVILVALPDTPASVRWLSAPEKAWFAARLAQDRAEAEAQSEPSMLHMLRDPRILCLALANVCLMSCSYAFNLSAPAILKAGAGLSVTNVGYVIAGGGLVAAAMMLLHARSSDHHQERHLHLAVPFVIAAAMVIVIAVNPSPLLLCLAYVVWVCCSLGTQPAFWSIPGAFLHGRMAAVGVAAIGAVGMIGAFLGPWAWGAAVDRTGGFTTGLFALAVPYLLAATLILLVRRLSRARVAARSAAAAAAE